MKCGLEDDVVLTTTYLLWEWRQKPSSAVSRRLHCWLTAFKRGRIILEEEEDDDGKRRESERTSWTWEGNERCHVFFSSSSSVAVF